MKTSELQGAALDWAVAKIVWSAHDDETNVLMVTCGDDNGWRFKPSTDWSQGGPIIEEQFIGSERWNAEYEWRCDIGGDFEQYGQTPLVAAMRCYVTSKLGDEVELPKELS